VAMPVDALFWLAGGLAVLLVVGLVMLRSLGRLWRKRLSVAEETPSASGQDRLGFVVETFHDLVSQLKDKERELERLRALAESHAASVEHLHHLVLQNISSGVIAVDGEGRITTFNAASERILGWKAEEVVGRPCREVFQEGSPLCTLLEQTPPPVRRREMEVRSRNGDPLWLGLSTSPLRDTEGTPIGTILTFTDLTEVRRLREQVELQERLRQMGEMSAGVAHELRNPMGVVSGYAAYLRKRLPSLLAQAGLPAQGPEAQAVEAILQETRTMDRIITELLNFAKPTELHVESVDLIGLVSELAESVDTRQGAIRVVRQCPPGPLSIQADEVLLRQALANLVLNAQDAMPAGGTLTLRVEPHPHEVRVEVRDTGEGIPPHLLPKVFLPFFTTKAHGTGLGLALAHKIVLAHGGRLWAESEQGKGTAMILTLPRGGGP